VNLVVSVVNVNCSFPIAHARNALIQTLPVVSLLKRMVTSTSVVFAQFLLIDAFSSFSS
jgi:hypothetical protein